MKKTLIELSDLTTNLLIIQKMGDLHSAVNLNSVALWFSCNQLNVLLCLARVIDVSNGKIDVAESCLEETGGLGVDIVVDAGGM